MKVFVTGATGALGRVTVSRLVADGHEVRGVARSATKADELRARGAEPVSVDLFDAAAVADALGEVDAVAHLATNVPPLAKSGRRKAWEQHQRLRAEATPILVDAARDAGASVFVKESVCFFYEPRDDVALDEEAQVVRAPFTAPTLDGEVATESFAGSGRRAVVLRFGLFYGPRTRGLDEALRLARVGLAPFIGRPDGYQPMIHVDDAAAAVLAALDSRASGIYNVADRTITRIDNLAAFAAAFSLRRVPRPLPPRMMRLLAGRPAAVLGASRRISSDRFRAEAGWQPAYPTPIDGWPAVARAQEVH